MFKTNDKTYERPGMQVFLIHPVKMICASDDPYNDPASKDYDPENDLGEI